MKNPLQKDVAKILLFATELPVEEDARAGRSWWENNEKKECGLHVAYD